VEKEASIGGHMAGFDKTFPTLDCAACILTPKMVSVGQHPNIRLVTFAEVVEVSGHVGSFKVKIRKRARYVDVEKCNGCGLCYQMCPAQTYPAERVLSLAGKPFKQVHFGLPKPAKTVRIPVVTEPAEQAAG